MARVKQSKIKLRFNGKRVNERTLSELIIFCNDIFNNAYDMLYEGEDLNKVYGYIARSGIELIFEGME